jgi:hypothetical protein
MLDDERTIVVPDGFETDLISSPRWLWSFIPPADKGKEAAVLHDYLLSQGIPRKICDRHFYAALEWLGQKTVKKWCMYYGVRLYSLFVKAKTGK